MTDDDASPPSVNLELPERHLMTQGPPSHAIMSISTRTDISPTSSGSSNYPRTVADQVGGCGLTLTDEARSHGGAGYPGAFAGGGCRRPAAPNIEAMLELVDRPIHSRQGISG